MSKTGQCSALKNTLFNHPSIAKFNGYSRAVFRDLSICHTAKKGMHYMQCDNEQCAVPTIQYHACGNRHCPNCGGMKREIWIEDKTRDLLPTSYFHIVFTLPHELNGLTMGNRKAMFKLLFDASSYTLLKLGQDPKYLGATLGIISVLHTWGQDLSFHPHVHCIVSGGGINQQNNWIKEKRANHQFIFPKWVLQNVFKGYYLKELRKRLLNGEIITKDRNAMDETIKTIGYKKWNVYAKAPFGGPSQVIEYLGRYTHKIAITAHRIKAISDTHITFDYKDYADGNQKKEMTISNEEFLRRFEQHILPKGFVKIRNYGYLKNHNKQARLNALVEQMNLPRRPDKVYIPMRIRLLEKYGRDISICPHCEQGKMKLVYTYQPSKEFKVPKVKCIEVKDFNCDKPPP